MLCRRRMRTGWPLAISLAWAAPTAAKWMKIPPGAVLALKVDDENSVEVWSSIMSTATSRVRHVDRICETQPEAVVI